MTDMELLLRDYRLTTAEIIYHLPDHPALLQTFVWQEYDKNPDFPRLNDFLAFWERKIEGKLHSVNVTSCEFIQPSELSLIDGEYKI
tara:strand:+ start:459 stop:719 length:261 start_codon:yes stop_codon:yes gene_type:complete